MEPRTRRRADLPPPVASVGALGWIRRNLFSSPLNTLLTLGALYLIYLAFPPMIRWALVDANWTGDRPVWRA